MCHWYSKQHKLTVQIKLQSWLKGNEPHSLVRIASYSVFSHWALTFFPPNNCYTNQNYVISNLRNIMYLKELHQTEGLISANDTGTEQATTKFWMKN